MEKKSLITLVVIATSSLLWVFNFLGRDNVSDDFTRQAQLQINSEECEKSTSKTCTETLPSLKPGFATHEQTQTSYVLRPDQSVADGVEQVRLTIEQPTSPRCRQPLVASKRKSISFNQPKSHSSALSHCKCTQPGSA